MVWRGAASSGDGRSPATGCGRGARKRPVLRGRFHDRRRLDKLAGGLETGVTARRTPGGELGVWGLTS